MTDPTPELAVAISNLNLTLTSRAGPVEILRELNLDVKKGEALGIVGPSGSGKTSLLMVMAGLEPASSGEVVISGVSLAGRNENQLAKFRRDNIGIIFQSFHLIPTMTALENVAIPLEFKNQPGSDGKSPLKIAEESLAQVGLSHRLHHYPSQLSGGEQQRVAIARAIASDAKILLADEPTGNLDQETGHHIISLLFDLKKQKQVTLLLITHDMGLAQRCDRVAEVRDGRIITSQAPPMAATADIITGRANG